MLANKCFSFSLQINKYYNFFLLDSHNKGEGIKIEFVKRRLNKNDKINGITRVPRRQQPYPTQQMDKSLCLMCANRPLYMCPVQ